MSLTGDISPDEPDPRVRFEPDDKLTRWRRQCAEQEERFERERAAESRKQQAQARAAHEPLLVATNQRIGSVEVSILELARDTNKIAEATSPSNREREVVGASVAA
jgi:hypothetical protein